MSVTSNFPKRLYNIRSKSIIKTKNLRSIEYITISHRWNNNEETNVRFEGIDWSCRLSDVQKINVATPSANSSNVPYLWIDTLCIDQKSSEEKSEEINKMHDIYSNAKYTIAFVNIIDNFDEKMKEFIKSINNLMKIDLTIDDYLDIKPYATILNDGYNTFCTLLADEWFARVWTLQEMLLSNQVKITNLLTGNEICTLQQCEKIYHIYNIYTSSLVKRYQNEPIPNFLDIVDHGIDGISQLKKIIPCISRIFAMCKKRDCYLKEDFAYGIAGLLNVKIRTIYGIGKESAIKELLKEVVKNGDVSVLDYYGPKSNSSYMPDLEYLNIAYPPVNKHSIMKYPHVSAELTTDGLHLNVKKRIELVNRRNLDLIGIKEHIYFLDAVTGYAALPFILAGDGKFANYIDITRSLTWNINPDDYIKDISSLSELAASTYNKIYDDFEDLNISYLEFIQEIDNRISNDSEGIQSIMIFNRLNNIMDLCEQASQNAFLANTFNGASVIAYVNGQNCFKEDMIEKICNKSLHMFLINHSNCTSPVDLVASSMIVVSSTNLYSEKVIRIGTIEAVSKDIFDEMSNDTEMIVIQ